jgi:hypothetical protein
MMTAQVPFGVDLLAALEKSKAHRRDLAIASRWAIDLIARKKVNQLDLVLAFDGEFDDVAAALKEEDERFALCVRLLRERQETQR